MTSSRECCFRGCECLLGGPVSKRCAIWRTLRESLLSVGRSAIGIDVQMLVDERQQIRAFAGIRSRGEGRKRPTQHIAPAAAILQRLRTPIVSMHDRPYRALLSRDPRRLRDSGSRTTRSAIRAPRRTRQ